MTKKPWKKDALERGCCGQAELQQIIGVKAVIHVFCFFLYLWVAFDPLAGQPHHHMPSLPTMWAKTCTLEGFCAVPLADSIWVPKQFRKCNWGTRQGFGCLVWIASLTPSQAVLKLSDVHHADVTAKEWVYGSKNLGHSMFLWLNLSHSYVPNIPATSLYGIILRDNHHELIWSTKKEHRYFLTGIVTATLFGHIFTWSWLYGLFHFMSWFDQIWSVCGRSLRG